MEIDGGQDVDFWQQTQNFLQWFQALPGATFHKDIKLEDLRRHGAGRGIIATANIEPDTVLFTIPRSSIISITTSTLATQIPTLFSQEDDDDAASDNEQDSSSQHDPWTRLILVLMYEYLRGDQSPWKPYLDVLPTTFDTPMFWPDADLASLQASSVVSKIGRASAEDMIRSKILPVIAAYQSVFFPGPDGQQQPSESKLLNLAHRCGSAIMAYAFDLEKDSGDSDDDNDENQDGWVEDRDGRRTLGMVPMADMLNADAEFNAHIHHGEADLRAVALRPIRAGDEVLNYYGPLPNGELLRRYGYVTARHARYDVVELPWTLVEARIRACFRGIAEAQWDKVGAVLARRAEEEGEEFDDSFVLERETDDPDSTGRFQGDARFGGLPEELGERVKGLLKTVKKVCSVDEALSDRAVRNKIYLESVLGALADREGQYVTTLEEDEQLLGSSRPAGRQEMAVFVRAGEKRLLREARAWVSQELEKVRSEIASSRQTERADEGAPAAKRRRT